MPKIERTARKRTTWQTIAAVPELTQQQTEEARKAAELNKSRAKNAKRQLVKDCNSVKDSLTKHISLQENVPPEEVPVEVVYIYHSSS